MRPCFSLMYRIALAARARSVSFNMCINLGVFMTSGAMRAGFTRLPYNYRGTNSVNLMRHGLQMIRIYTSSITT